ncbi:hypothetical protein ND928_01085 [Vibrio diabolicus]|uniref:hypothetical protein n=1 Tax=Vibrio diabolicus TaxID=50719 RepID=UPI00215DEFDA|nr:hypothetical protein [Vibrio diabolicus]MCS0362988.1 hypothetical protein [Vibrio diabolicus]
MSLDHFRPQKVFAERFEITSIHPYNLYLSCQKCNVLKSSDWHGCIDTINGATYSASVGYIDRFSDKVDDFLEVKQGEIIPLQPPVGYMIKKMHLNRPNRVYFRHLRELRHKKKLFETRLSEMMRTTMEQVKNNEISKEEAIERLGVFTEAQGKLATLVI